MQSRSAPSKIADKSDRMPTEELATLLRVSSELASTLDLPVVMQVAITSVCEVLEIDTGAIYLIDGATLQLGATAPPLDADFPAEYLAAPLGDHPHIESCLDTGTPVRIEDTAAEPMTPAERGVCESRDLRSILYVPLFADGATIGTFIVGSSGTPRHFSDADMALCRTLAHQISLALANAKLHDSLLAANAELMAAYDATLLGWANALEMRDKETRGHADRVVDLTLRMARSMGIDGVELEHVRRGTLLHDIGKMAIPDTILNKPGPLTDDEWIIMRQHPTMAYELLSSIDYLAPALDIPCSHHERWDGTGYPQGLSGEQIPLPARIFALVDVYDALTSDRPYRRAWSREEALAHIRKQSGQHFDPDLVEVFFAALEDSEL